MRKFLCLLTILAMVVSAGCLENDIASGPDKPVALDGSGEVDGSFDLVLPAPGTEPSTYGFTIEWGQDGSESYPPGTPIMICDTVPEEWQVVQVITYFNTVYEVVDGFLQDAPDGLGGTGMINVFPANEQNGGDKGNSATKIEYIPDAASGLGYVNVVVTTRERLPGDGTNATIEWAPTSCGRLYLNEGAVGYEIDENGDLVLDAGLNPVVLEEQTDPLFVVAVFDVDGDGIIVRDGSGDEDADGIVDGEDNCPCGDNSNPVNTDLDDDGVPNENDSCPFTPIGDVADPANGCSIDQLVPCEGPFGTTTTWKNHGQYVKTITHTAKSFFEQGLITEGNRGTIVSRAASSDCGDK